mgnify:FL=1
MSDIQFVALDVETTLNGNGDIGLAHPMCPDNYVVLYGIGDNVLQFVSPDVTPIYTFFKTSKPVIVCGHNLSFDLMYVYKESPYLKEWLQNNLIWDTQLAEYILSGQRTKFASLDELCVLYGLPLKEDKIKKYFEAGIGSDKIPREELEPYLKQDISNTYQIALMQYDKAKVAGQLPLIWSQMKALHATTEMMYNGLHIDKATLDAYTVDVVNDFVDVTSSLTGVVEDLDSPKQWSQYFFGGTKKVKVKEEVGFYKNGNVKYKTVEKEVAIPSKTAYLPDKDKISEKTGQVSVDDQVLSDMLNYVVDLGLVDTITKLLKYREVSKQLSTYVKGLSKHIIEYGDSYYIHGKLNHTSTVTGRLSSTNPNLQNISNNPIKKIFTSRFEKGVIVEVDFNQLEVVALAHITRDARLIADISAGVDIHSALYEQMFGRKPTKEERKPFKSRTFQLIYGAGASAIAKQAGCSLDEAKKFIEVFYTRYPSVASWHESFARVVDSSGTYLTDVVTGIKDKSRTYIHKTETGRKFVFKEYFNEKAWSTRMYNFSPTEMKNYPVQGLATGDIVPMMLGVIFDKFKGRGDVKMVNTIHDSLMFDVKAESAADFILEVTDVLKDTHVYFEETFKVPLALKLNAGASFGVNWFDMEEVNL